jgi:creatinine amidohydrolase
MGAIADVVGSLRRHGFYRFFLLNGHGGNTEPNGIALRKLKEQDSKLQVGHSGYYAYVTETCATLLKGRVKEIQHACEAETSLMLHFHPGLVRTDKLIDDGLVASPNVRGMVWMFDERSQNGPVGQATLATAELGKQIAEAAIRAIVMEFRDFRNGIVLVSEE